MSRLTLLHSSRRRILRDAFHIQPGRLFRERAEPALRRIARTECPLPSECRRVHEAFPPFVVPSCRPHPSREPPFPMRTDGDGIAIAGRDPCLRSTVPSRRLARRNHGDGGAARLGRHCASGVEASLLFNVADQDSVFPLVYLSMGRHMGCSCEGPRVNEDAPQTVPGTSPGVNELRVPPSCVVSSQYQTPRSTSPGLGAPFI